MIETLLCATLILVVEESRVVARHAGDVVHVELISQARAVGGDAVKFTTIHTAGAPKPYLYPVFGPGGARMTRGYPMDRREHEEPDHPHHRSMWFAHGEVNGHDFWAEGDGKGTIDVESVEVDGARVVLHCVWNSAAGELVCRERRVMSFAATTRDRWIDVESTIEAPDHEVRFGDTKEGTMALRLAPTLRLEGSHASGSAFNANGIEGKAIWGKRSRYVHYSGPVDGRAVGVTIFDHPANPRHPTWWHARAYGLFAANPFGVRHFEGKPRGTGDLVLPPGRSVTFRHRVVFHDGARDAVALDASADALPVAPRNPLTDAGEVERVADGFRFTEGPAWDRSRGVLYFSDIPSDRIHVLRDGECSVFREPSRKSNGLLVDASGALLACEHDGRAVTRTSADGTVVSVADAFVGGRLNSPNDLALREDGNLYFTDPPYGLRGHASDRETSDLFRRSPDGEITSLWSGPVATSRPNGVALSADQRRLYVAFTDEAVVRVFELDEVGAVAASRTFTETSRGPDGMAVDRDGNLFVTTSAGVEVFAPDGARLGVILVPEQPANCAFGGADGDHLYITARTGVYRVRVGVAAW